MRSFAITHTEYLCHVRGIVHIPYQYDGLSLIVWDIPLLLSLLFGWKVFRTRGMAAEAASDLSRARLRNTKKTIPHNFKALQLRIFYACYLAKFKIHIQLLESPLRGGNVRSRPRFLGRERRRRRRRRRSEEDGGRRGRRERSENMFTFK